ncbi:hypothetical protein PYW08_007802 [Mythimna loreyi]|uniref:Uncharacterized protein n=1 Tax=Mythimna loreyi TaxID=667449 RepID=A0ACC2QDD1_9NEOP|nr:hypothetical protein PYW08_007802 [Mythimna loreyi]
MEQMYLIEIFIDKVTIYATDKDPGGTDNKNLIIKVKFGPNVQFIVKEGQLAVNEKQDDIVVTDEKTGRRQWSRTIRVGKSYLFPSFPDTMLMILSKFPLEIEVWNDDANELPNLIFVGVGNMHWDTHFFHMIKETANPCKMHQPLSIKSKTIIMAECCCVQAGEVDFILRLSALGNSIITEYQQLLKDPELFVFRTNKAPSMFQCKRVEGDDPNFCMVGSLYETTTLEDPELIDKANKKIEVCTELQSCGMGGKVGEFKCDRPEVGSAKKKYAIDKIKMGDIVGPCGNANCALAHRVRTYIRNLESYKKKAIGIKKTKPGKDNKVCGKCVCKDDRNHRDDCPKPKPAKSKCEGCGGMALAGQTCKQKVEDQFGTGATPKSSKTKVAGKGTPRHKASNTKVNYLFSNTQFPNYKQGMFGQDTIVEDCFCTKIYPINNIDSGSKACTATSEDVSKSSVIELCHKGTSSKSNTNTLVNKTTVISMGISSPFVYNVHSDNQTFMGTSYETTTYNVETSTACSTDPKRKTQAENKAAEAQEKEEKDCKCTPKKPAPPCKTFDCDCLSEAKSRLSRKVHKPFCPLYKHKTNCPVTMMNVEEEQKKLDEDEEEVTPLPYGLPPIKLGPCPVLGRPCSVPDGFARMYKNAQVPTQPFSYSTDGKVCCSKEYERIKKAIREYVKNDKESDYRCLNQFNVDTERRCCDKEQILMSLTGKACCGSHKMAIQDKFKKDEKKP